MVQSTNAQSFAKHQNRNHELEDYAKLQCKIVHALSIFAQSEKLYQFFWSQWKIRLSL